MTSHLRVWWSHALKMIIHWWIKYASYVVRLGVGVQKTSRFLMAKSGRFSAKHAYKRRFKSYDKWSCVRAPVLLDLLGLLGKTDRMLGGYLGLFPQLSIGHERSCKIFCLNYFKPVIKPEDSTLQTQFAQWVRRKGSFKIVFFFFANMQHYTGK